MNAAVFKLACLIERESQRNHRTSAVLVPDATSWVTMAQLRAQPRLAPHGIPIFRVSDLRGNSVTTRADDLYAFDFADAHNALYWYLMPSMATKSNGRAFTVGACTNRCIALCTGQ